MVQLLRRGSSPQGQICSLFLLLVLISSAMGALLGIDYGQQFVKAMVVSPQAPLELVLTPEAKRKDVAGLAIKRLYPGNKKNSEIERIYGAAVGSLETRFPHNVAMQLKPLLGMTLNDTDIIETYKKNHPGVQIVATARNSLALVIDKIEYPIEELVAMNLQEITNRANSLLREKDHNSRDYVDMLAITVPEYFNQNQRMALVDSCSFIDKSQGAYLINDGLSVAINFAIKQQRNFDVDQTYNYIVYDIGGGSTTATLVSIVNPSNSSDPMSIEIRGYGHSTIGGDDLTSIVSDIISKKFVEKYSSKVSLQQLTSNSKSMAKIRQIAEKMKLVLSANTDANGSIESLIDDIDFRVAIKREEFEAELQNYKQLLMDPINTAVGTQFSSDNTDEVIAIEDLAGLLLTGGSTRVPFVQQNLLEIVNDENKILKSINADESAVNGATLRGIKLFNAFKTKPLNIVERSIYDYSIQYLNTTNKVLTNETIFAKGSVYPSEKSIIIPSESETKDFTLTMFENGIKLSDVKFNDILEFNKEHCPGGINYNVTFNLNEIRTLSIKSIKASCLKEKNSKEFETETEIETSTGPTDSTNNSTTSSSKKRENRYLSSVHVEFTEQNTKIESFSYKERLQHINHIRGLDEQDKKRFQIQEAKNLLESSLYDARNFLTEEEVVANGPAGQLENLSDLVTQYLEWLEDDSDNAKKSEIVKKRKEIENLKNKIQNYLKSVGEPLDLEQFEELLERAETILDNIEEQKSNSQQMIHVFEETLAEIPFNFTQAYVKVKLPKHLVRSFKKWNETVASVNQTYAAISKLIEKNDFDKLDREELYELKTSFDGVMSFVEEQDVLKSVEDYRFHELKSMYQRQLRAERRKAEKAKRKEAKEKGSVESDKASDETNVAESSTPASYATATSTSSVSEPLHDEL